MSIHVNALTPTVNTDLGSTVFSFFATFLSPANEVWGKVMFSQVFVHSGG